MDVTFSQDEWVIGEQLKQGGFGGIFEATRAGGSGRAVAKFVKKEPGAQRELLFAESNDRLVNVVPILDTGETDDTWVLVMPRAEKSLGEVIRARGGQPLPDEETLKVLTDVVDALASMDGVVVHRDLKPDNVLLLDGTWCVSDFGISRYYAAATASDTRKYNLTAPYAAPEQWAGEHATSAADVYAFGVMAFELLSGSRPFAGPDVPDFREQHLTATPPPLVSGQSRLRFLVEECLLKRPEARPRPANVRERLAKAQRLTQSAAAADLIRVNQAVASRKAADQAAQASRALQAKRLSEIATDGARTFGAFVEPILDSLENDAPTAIIDRNAGGGVMEFVAEWEGAKFGVKTPRPCSAWDGPFTVVSTSTIAIRYTRPRASGWRGRSHSLWYCDAYDEGVFRWYELAFMDSPLFSQLEPKDTEPHALEPDVATEPFAKVVGTAQLALPVEELDRDDPEPFIEKWLRWFAAAAAGTLRQPSTMPERPDNGRWRH